MYQHIASGKAILLDEEEELRKATGTQHNVGVKDVQAKDKGTDQADIDWNLSDEEND